MKFEFREFTITNTKNDIKEVNFFLFCNGANKNAKDWLLSEQSVRGINFRSHKVFNQTSRKTIQNSIFIRSAALINSAGFIFTPDFLKEETPQNLTYNFEKAVDFVILAFKLNHNFVSVTETKKLVSLKYADNKLLFFKFNTLNLKF